MRFSFDKVAAEVWGDGGSNFKLKYMKLPCSLQSQQKGRKNLLPAFLYLPLWLFFLKVDTYKKEMCGKLNGDIMICSWEIKVSDVNIRLTRKHSWTISS